MWYLNFENLGNIQETWVVQAWLLIIKTGIPMSKIEAASTILQASAGHEQLIFF